MITIVSPIVFLHGCSVLCLLCSYVCCSGNTSEDTFLLTLHRSAEWCSHILPKLKHEVATEAHRKTRIGTIAALHFGRRSKSKARNNEESSVVMDKVSLS